jgi:hypothetical protein
MRLSSQLLPLGPADGRLTSREWTVLVLGALALTVLVCLAEPSIFTSSDWLALHVFYKPYIRDAVLQGRLPLWNPYASLGRPLLADADSAFFYPPDVVYLLFNLYVACAIACALHFLVCLYGMVKLARAIGVEPRISFGVAFVFAGSAPVVGCFTSGYIHYGPSVCLVPLVFYLGMRLQSSPGLRAVAVLALVLGLQHTCGHPQAAWLTSVGLVAFLLGRRLERNWRHALCGLVLDAGWLALAVGLGSALAAVSLLPLAELAGQGNRQAASLAFSGAFAEPASGWATLLVPTDLRFFHFQANAQLYAGIATVLLGVAGLVRLRDRHMRGLFLLIAFAGLLAAGNGTPFFKLFFHAVPGVALFRIHSRATLLVTLALVLSAGLFLSRPSPRPRMDLVAFLIVAVAGLGISVAFVLGWPGYGDSAPIQATLRAALVAGTTAIGVLCLRPPRWLPDRRVPELALVLLLALDLGSAGASLKQQNRGHAEEEQEDAVRRALVATGNFSASGVPPRVYIPTFRENAGMQQGWSSPFGYASLNLGRVWNYMHDTLGVLPPIEHNTFPSLELAHFGPIPYPSMALVMGADPRAKRLMFSPRPDPRVYLVEASRMVRDAREATELMRVGHDFHKVALVEQAIALPGHAVSDGRATITRFEPERISIAVESPSPALLVLAEPWYPGWEARVNHSAAPCVPANAWMRAVPVPAGTSQVEMTFHSTYLLPGALISLATLVAILWMLFRRRAAPAT